MKQIALVEQAVQDYTQQESSRDFYEQVYYVTHLVHNKRQRDGRINRFDSTTGVYSANSVSPYAERFLELNVEDGVKDIVAALNEKGFYTYSSCAGHCMTDRRFVGIAFPNELMKVRFLTQMRALEKYGIVFNELDTVINQKSEIHNGDLNSTPLGESGQRFTSLSEETAVFNIQFHTEAQRFHFVEMVLLEEYSFWDILAKPRKTIQLIATRLFHRNSSTVAAARFIKNDIFIYGANMLKQTNTEKRPSFSLVREGKPDFHFIPGSTYVHAKRGGNYRLIGISNATATDPDYPPQVVYENIETNELWTKGPERFADGMTLKF